MKCKKLFFILLFAFVFVPMCKAQSQVTTNILRSEFNTTKYVYLNKGTKINTTKGVLMLNITKNYVYENFSLWNEINSIPDYLSLTNNTFLTYNGNMRNNINNRVTKNNFTKNFDYHFRFNVDEIANSASTMRGDIIQHSNNTEDWRYQVGNNEESNALLLRSQNSNTKYQFYLQCVENGVSNVGGGTGDLDVDTWYFVRYNRSGYNVGVFVYSDSSFSSLVTSAIIDCSGIWSKAYKFSKIIAMSNVGYATNLDTKCYLNFLYIGESDDYTNGSMYSINMLENTTRTLYSMSLNISSINGASSSIEVFASNDNLTWSKIIETVETKGKVEYLFNRDWNNVYFRFHLIGNGYNPEIDYFEVSYFAEGVGTTTPLFLHWIVWVLAVLVITIIIATRRKIT